MLTSQVYKSTNQRYNKIYSEYKKKTGEAKEFLTKKYNIESFKVYHTLFVCNVAGFHAKDIEKFPKGSMRETAINGYTILIPDKRTKEGKKIYADMLECEGKLMTGGLNGGLLADIASEMRHKYVPPPKIENKYDYKDHAFWSPWHEGNRVYFPRAVVRKGVFYAKVPLLPDEKDMERVYPIPDHWEEITEAQYKREMAGEE